MTLKIVFVVVYLAAVQAKHIDSNENENWSNWQEGSHQYFQPSNYYMRARNFATRYHDANRGRMSGKEFPRVVFQEMEGHARRSGCNRGCLMCLSQIKCTDEMKEFSPERCHNYGGSSSTAQGSMPYYEESSSKTHTSMPHYEGSSNTAHGSMPHYGGSSSTVQGSMPHYGGSSSTAHGLMPHYEGSSSTAQGTMTHIPGFSDMEPMQQFMAQVTQCEDCTNECLKGLAHVHCSDHLRKWMPQICSQFGDKNQSQVDTI